MKKLAFLLISFLMLPNITLASDEPEYIPCSESFFADGPTPLPQLKEYNELAKSVGIQVCRNVLQITDTEKKEVAKAVNEFTSMTKASFGQMFKGNEFNFMHDTVDVWASLVNKHYNNPDYLGFIQSALDVDGGNQWQVFVTKYHTINRPSISLDKALNDQCKTVIKSSNGCLENFRFISDAANPFVSLVKDNILTTNADLLRNMQADWNLFIEEARYQTPLDVWLTTKLSDDLFEGKGLSGPPTVQYFLLHPSIVYERIGNLPDGDQDEVALAVEWFGVNLWKYKMGVSIVSTYQDIAETSDVGTGLMFHVDNAYSFGFTHRGKNDNSVFINFDLLQLIGDKKDMYKAYKANMFN